MNTITGNLKDLEKCTNTNTEGLNNITSSLKSLEERTTTNTNDLDTVTKDMGSLQTKVNNVARSINITTETFTNHIKENQKFTSKVALKGDMEAIRKVASEAKSLATTVTKVIQERLEPAVSSMASKEDLANFKVDIELAQSRGTENLDGLEQQVKRVFPHLARKKDVDALETKFEGYVDALQIEIEGYVERTVPKSDFQVVLKEIKGITQHIAKKETGKSISGTKLGDIEKTLQALGEGLKESRERNKQLETQLALASQTAAETRSKSEESEARFQSILSRLEALESAPKAHALDASVDLTKINRDIAKLKSRSCDATFDSISKGAEMQRVWQTINEVKLKGDEAFEALEEEVQEVKETIRELVETDVSMQKGIENMIVAWQERMGAVESRQKSLDDNHGKIEMVVDNIMDIEHNRAFGDQMLEDVNRNVTHLEQEIADHSSRLDTLVHRQRVDGQHLYGLGVVSHDVLGSLVAQGIYQPDEYTQMWADTNAERLEYLESELEAENDSQAEAAGTTHFEYDAYYHGSANYGDEFVMLDSDGNEHDDAGVDDAAEFVAQFGYPRVVEIDDEDDSSAGHDSQAQEPDLQMIKYDPEIAEMAEKKKKKPRRRLKKEGKERRPEIRKAKEVKAEAARLKEVLEEEETGLEDSGLKNELRDAQQETLSSPDEQLPRDEELPQDEEPPEEEQPPKDEQSSEDKQPSQTEQPPQDEQSAE